MSDTNLSNLRINGQTLSADVTNAITKASLYRSFDSSPTLAITLNDQKRTLLRSGYFAQRLTCQLDDHSFELVQLKKSKNQMTLTFEDLAVAELRRHNTPRKAEAGTVTRIQFVQQVLADESPWIKLFVDPSVHEQPAKVELARGTFKSASTDSADPNYFSSGASVHTTAAALGASQIAGVAKAAGFSGDGLVIAIAVALAESSGRPEATNRNTNGSTDFGLWQINSIHKEILSGGNWADPAYNAKVAYQVSGKGKSFNPWVAYKTGAYKTHLNAARTAAGSPSSYSYSGATSGGSSPDPTAKPEDSWSCFKRIFAEINWRIYVDKGNLYAGPDSAFIDKDAIYSFSEFKDGVDWIDFDWDVGKVIATATITCRAPRWDVSPGSVVNLPNIGLDLKWLVASFTRDLKSVSATIVVKAPEPELPEPENPSASANGEYFGDSAGGGSTTATGGANDGKYVWPVANRILTAPFGQSRPGHMHTGIDIGCSDGTSVVASRAGTVTNASNSDPKGYGNVVYIDHGDGSETRYAHLSGFTCRRGLQVGQGQQIGKSGHSGDATGPHLHFEIRQHGKAVDPIPLLSGGAKVGIIPGGGQNVPIQDSKGSTLAAILGLNK